MESIVWNTSWIQKCGEERVGTLLVLIVWQWVKNLRFYSPIRCTTMFLWCLDIRLLEFEDITIPQHLTWSLCLSRAQVSSKLTSRRSCCMFVHILLQGIYSVFWCSYQNHILLNCPCWQPPWELCARSITLHPFVVKMGNCGVSHNWATNL